VTALSYFDACCAWFLGLSREHRETVASVINAHTHNHKLVAERIAASLPAAPRCPF
jgi:hypothetical protein